MTGMYRGSRKHVLDWVEHPTFLAELLALVRRTVVRLTPTPIYMPLGYAVPREARLERFGPKFLPGLSAWKDLQQWWLAHPKGANTPNWDIALGCEINGQSGLILVESKANVPELSEGGKFSDPKASKNSKENHERIADAITEAREGFVRSGYYIDIDRDRHYQLSNRLAFTWKLATLGIPTVLVYLGFTGDKGISDAGEPFRDEAHWKEVFRAYAAGVKVASLFEQERPIVVNGTAIWCLIRARPVLENSPKLK